jgi:uncharacterized membrane protein
VPQAEWEALCRALEAAMHAGHCREGVLAAIDSVTRLLEQHFPARSANPNELPNEPFVN